MPRPCTRSPLARRLLLHLAPEVPEGLPLVGNVGFLETGRLQHVQPVMNVDAVLHDGESVGAPFAGLSVQIFGGDQGTVGEPAADRG